MSRLGPDAHEIYVETMEFNFEGMKRAEAGINLAVTSRAALVTQIRAGLVAIALKRSNRTATADDIDAVLTTLESTYGELGNAAGGIFRDGNWEFTGNWEKSRRASNNARYIMVWQLKEGQ